MKKTKIEELKVDYEKYLLNKINENKRNLEKSSLNLTSKITEIIKYQLERYEIRLFNYNKGRQEERKELIEEIIKIIDEILLNSNNISKGYVEISTIEYFKQKIKGD